MDLIKGLSPLFPRRCPLCSAVMPFGKTHCERCCVPDKPIVTRLDVRHPEGREMYIYTPLLYTGKYRTAIHRFKFRSKRAYAFSLARIAVECAADYLRDIDGVTCVPMLRDADEKRKYNHSELIAREAAEALNLEYKDLLIKKRKTGTQHLLEKSKRMRNLRGAYGVIGTEFVRGKTILLVDDILTTGETMRECGAMLYRAGAKKVVGICVAFVPPK